MQYFINIFVFVLLCSANLCAQATLDGIIVDERNEPIPLAKVYVKNNAAQRTVCDVEGYFKMRLLPGEYYLVIRAGGYQSKEVYVGMGEANMHKNIPLLPEKVQTIKNMEVNADKSNPGRDIMLKVVEKRDKINPWNYPHRVDAYIRATEKIHRKDETNQEEESKSTATDPNGIEDPFTEKKRQETIAGNMNLVEVELQRDYAPFNLVKEKRNAFEQRGSSRNLYYTTTVKSNFNFFENLLRLNDLHQTPVSSPISGPGILSYKYRLVDQYEENGQLIHKIKIIPRNIATTTLEGFVYVVDSLWLVQKLDLTMEKGNLLIYDYFKIHQEFDHPGDSICVLQKQVLDYGVNYRKENSTCKTTATFSNYDFDIQFPKRYFSNELSVTEKEAYEKDSSYWSAIRQTDLSSEELQYIYIKDSIQEAHEKKAYLDSVDAVFNKITFLKVLWFGIDHRNRTKKTQWTLSSIAALSRPVYIAGPRVAPNLFYFKKWESERSIDSYSEISYGFLNQDIKGATWWRFRYDPFHFGTAALLFEHDFDAIQWNNAFTEVYKRSNFIERTALRVNNDYEIANGLYLFTEAEFSERRSLRDYAFLGKADSIFPNNDPTEFEDYQALLGNAKLSFTPGQKYMREPNRKVLLGSSWPTFYVSYERGIPQLFGSDINHEYLRLGIEQTFKLGLLGTTNYHAWTGKFLSSKKLRNADYKYFRPSDPIWFSDPLNSFQGLDTSLPSTKMTYVGHIVHHDNGSIINKIPFMKKTRIGLVIGAGGLYIEELNWQHYELLVGLERIFKLSKRRLRIGVYGVLSDGNNMAPTPTWKVSFSLLDNRNMKWNF